MPDDELADAQWRKSTYSGNTGNCVEIAIADSLVRIRDSKDPQGAVLSVNRAEWEEFISSIKELGQRL